MAGIRDFDAVQPQLTFETAAGRSKTALWSRGRSIVLIVEGREHEFRFNGTLTETRALALLSEHHVPVEREDAARIAVFRTAAVCLLALVLLFLIT
ncbi:hypothetical protein [Xaviernesmea oryzae]|uniref:Uncharacterized protein n=1 Tax=Xaviernesmea oryzae TaxID=464029 RepID=A0A1X7DM47_9HYPH|nr:hypothetical protein [Xaviernesmea oryzae]SMF17439.1 hypothetical protein SAMN02982989_5536 [Xaviernesmea oryzae]